MAIKIKNTNPAHVFEIRPVIKINDINSVSSLQKIDGFKYKDAEAAFTAYSNARCRIVPKTKTITIETNGVGYNYVDFWIRVNEDSKTEVSDGMFVYATVLGGDFDHVILFVYNIPPWLIWASIIVALAIAAIKMKPSVL